MALAVKGSLLLPSQLCVKWVDIMILGVITWQEGRDIAVRNMM
jgi:hypothetical protein